MIRLLCIVAAALLAWSTVDDVRSTDAALGSGHAAEGSSFYVRAGRHWKAARFAVMGCGIAALVVLAYFAPAIPAIAIAGAVVGAAWSVRTFYVARRNWRNAGRLAK